MAYFIISNEDIANSEEASASVVEKTLKTGTVPEKRKAMKLLLRQIVNDENYPRMMMTVLTNV